MLTEEMVTIEDIGRAAVEYLAQFRPTTWVIVCAEELTPEQKRRRLMPKCRVYSIPERVNKEK